jgi:hypothetical protein
VSRVGGFRAGRKVRRATPPARRRLPMPGQGMLIFGRNQVAAWRVRRAVERASQTVRARPVVAVRPSRRRGQRRM